MPAQHPARLPLILAFLTAVVASAHARQSVEQPSDALPVQASAPSTSTFKFEKFCVAADHPMASEAGARILRAGGNAVDAAVATSFALSVVRPFSCGIGGGGFMIIHRNGQDTALNYREMAPAAVTADFYEKIDDPSAPRLGGRAVGVPGTVAGLLHALEKYGTLDRATVLAPAIRLAGEGFAADEAYVKAAKTVAKQFTEHPEYQTRFAFTWSRLVREGHIAAGDIIKLPEQAAAFELISRDGLAGFYQGAVAKALVQTVAGDGGALAATDLAGFPVKEVEPLRGPFDSGAIISMPPPSSGGLAMIETLGILQRTGFHKDAQEHNWGAYSHLLAESFRHAFADRARWLGDPDVVDVPVTRILSGANLDALAARTKVARAGPAEVYGSRFPDMDSPPAGDRDDGGTSHFCVIDAQGNAVACTETINLLFGSKLAVAEFGFCLNNQMDDFTTRRGQANAFGLRQSDLNLPAPGKRPLSSMSPTIVLDEHGKVRAIAGGSGGPRIITATTQVLLNALVRGDDAGRAVSRPRIHHQWSPDVLEIEPGFDERHNGLAVEFWLKKLHHKTVPATDGAAVQLILRRDTESGGQVLEAASDPRKGGRPAGE